MAKKQKSKNLSVDAVSGADIYVKKPEKEVVFVEPPRQYIKVKDTRKLNALTGLPLDSSNRKHADIPLDYAQMTIAAAKKHGVDPATALAIGLQETGYKKEWLMNPFMLGNYDQYGDVIEQSVKFMAEKNKQAKKLGKKSEEDIIQAYNGYGTLAGAGKMYGIDTAKTPIDMNKNPLYGKTVKNLRDSVIMQNPEILNLIKGNDMKTPVQKLKCGGKKKKMMANGGINAVPIDNLKIPTLAPAIDTQTLVPGPKGLKGSGGSSIPFQQLGDMAGNYVDKLITDSIDPYTDNRENPNSYLKERDRKTSAGNIAGNTLKGAGVGATIGSAVPVIGTGVGAAIGAGVGALSTSVKKLLTSKKKKDARTLDQENWGKAWTGDSASRLSAGSYKDGGEKGGKIKGEGGPKSDSIDKNVTDGSFIVPAENAQKAMELGKNYLGWKGSETAGRKYPGTEVSVSNGEVLFTPEEVDVLRYHGLDLNKLAPNAEPGNKMKNGGKKYTEALATYSKQYKESSPSATDAEIEQDFKDMIEANPGFGVDSPAPEEAKIEGERGPLGKIMDFAPEIAGAVQLGAAAVGLAKAGRMPDINVSEALRDITTESRQEAQYGLEPGTKSAMLNQAEKARRDVTNAIVTRGGSSAEVMANLQGVLSTTTDKKFDIELADSAEKIRKKSIYYGLKSKVADQEMDIAKMGREDWMQLQDINAGLLNAGISNIVGARKLKATMDMMKKVGSSSADISKIV